MVYAYEHERFARFAHHTKIITSYKTDTWTQNIQFQPKIFKWKIPKCDAINMK